MAAAPRTAPLNTPRGMLGRRAHGRGGENAHARCRRPSQRAPLHAGEGRKRREKAARRMRRSALPRSAGPWREKASGTGRDHPASTGGGKTPPSPSTGGHGHTEPPPQRVSHPPTPRVPSDPAEGGLRFPREDGVRLRRFWERTASLRAAPFPRRPGWASRWFFWGENRDNLLLRFFFSGWLCPPPASVAPRGGAKDLQGAGHVNVPPRNATCGRGYANGPSGGVAMLIAPRCGACRRSVPNPRRPRDKMAASPRGRLRLAFSSGTSSPCAGIGRRVCCCFFF